MKTSHNKHLCSYPSPSYRNPEFINLSKFKIFQLILLVFRKKCCLGAYIILSNFKVQSITCFDATNSAHCLPNVFTLKNKCFKNSFLVFILFLLVFINSVTTNAACLKVAHTRFCNYSLIKKYSKTYATYFLSFLIAAAYKSVNI